MRIRQSTLSLCTSRRSVVPASQHSAEVTDLLQFDGSEKRKIQRQVRLFGNIFHVSVRSASLCGNLDTGGKGTESQRRSHRVIDVPKFTSSWHDNDAIPMNVEKGYVVIVCEVMSVEMHEKMFVLPGYNK